MYRFFLLNSWHTHTEAVLHEPDGNSSSGVGTEVSFFVYLINFLSGIN